MSKLLLVDGHSIINRAFYGIPEMTNVHGEHTNALYGFLNILLKFMDDEKPDFLCVAFDVKAPTFRHEMFDAYKGTRKPMPAELHEQVPMLKELLHAMNIVTFEHAGWEADDILGSLAKRAESEGMEVSLISGDRDLLQIASDNIKICIPKTKGGQTITEYYHTEDVLRVYSLPPLGIIELKALMGDTADNIPGVPKVGEKTATDLLVKYGSLDGVYEHLDEITKPALHKNLEENKDKAYLSRTLATIKTDCDVDVTWEQLKIADMWNETSKTLFMRHGFKSFMKRFDKVQVSAPVRKELPLTIINDFTECEEMFKKLARKKDLSLFPVVCDGTLLAAALCDGNDSYVILSQWFITEDYLTDKINELCSIAKLRVFDAKKVYPFLQDINIDNIEDLLLIAYLNNAIKSDYTVEDIANEYLGIQIEPASSIFGKVALNEAMLTMTDAFGRYAGTVAEVLYQAYEPALDKLKSQEMEELYRTIELPLTEVLYSLEKAGILVDKKALVAFGESLVDRIGELETSIYEQAGEKFNINSPKQLGEILFGKLGLEGGKKTKSGYSTAADVLEKLANEYPIVKDILEYRGLAKLKSTYADGLMNCIAEDGRIHTTFNQTITATGRISSTEPNLQNIPVRTEQGRSIRKCFIPKPGYVFLDADYSQIELRLLAHMSDDPGLLEAYQMDADIHRITASRVFSIPFDEVTPGQRRDAKAVNFGVVYGISSFGLSQDLGISKKDALKYIEDYFETYPGVKSFLDNCVKDATDKGYGITMYGRRRPIPELKNSNFMVRSFGERVAMNSPIQGTAADIMKIAMIRVYKALKESGIDAKILIQVHDELLLEVKEEDLDAARSILADGMTGAASLRCRLEVDIHDGSDWYQLK